MYADQALPVDSSYSYEFDVASNGSILTVTELHRSVSGKDPTAVDLLASRAVADSNRLINLGNFC